MLPLLLLGGARPQVWDSGLRNVSRSHDLRRLRRVERRPWSTQQFWDDMATQTLPDDTQTLPDDTQRFDDDMGDSWVTHGLNVGQMMRLQEYRETHAGLMQRRKKRIDEAMLYDLEQGPDHRGRLGQNIASLITHNCFWSERMRRQLVRHEALSAQGWPSIWSKHVAPGVECHMPIPWLSLFTETSEAKAWQVIGNGMHVAQCLLVWLYIFSCGESVVHIRTSSQPQNRDHELESETEGEEDDDCVMLGIGPECAEQTEVIIDDD